MGVNNKVHVIIRETNLFSKFALQVALSLSCFRSKPHVHVADKNNKG